MPHLLHADDIPVVGVTVFADGNFEIKVGVSSVGLGFAQVPFHTAGTQHRTGHTERYAFPGGNLTHIFGALDPDTVGCKKFFVLANLGSDKIEKFLYLAFKPLVRFIHAPADAERVGSQPSAAVFLEDLENFFPIAKGVKKRRNGADIERMRAQPQHVAGEPVQFGKNYANVSGAGRSIHIQKFFHRFAIAQAVRHRRYVIHAVHVGIEHGVCAVLGNLLHAAMEVTDHALRPQNLFAVQFQNHTQHAVRRRMLRAHVDDELGGIEKGFLVLAQLQV